MTLEFGMFETRAIIDAFKANGGMSLVPMEPYREDRYCRLEGQGLVDIIVVGNSRYYTLTKEGRRVAFLLANRFKANDKDKEETE